MEKPVSILYKFMYFFSRLWAVGRVRMADDKCFPTAVCYLLSVSQW